MIKIKILSGLSLFTVLFVFGIPSHAQTVLEEIVVTAQKREQNIQDVPISITRMSGQWLESKFAGGEDVLALASTVPGLHVGFKRPAVPRFYIAPGHPFTQGCIQPVSSFLPKCRLEKGCPNHFHFRPLDDFECDLAASGPCSGVTPRRDPQVRFAPPHRGGRLYQGFRRQQGDDKRGRSCRRHPG